MQTILLFILPLFVSCQVRIYYFLMCFRICCHLIGLALCQTKSNRRLTKISKLVEASALKKWCRMSQSTKCFGSIVSLQCFIDIYWKVTDRILNKILYKSCWLQKYKLSFLSGLGPSCPKLAKQQQGEQVGGNVPSQRFFRCWSPLSKTGRSLTLLTERLIFPVSALTSMM